MGNREYALAFREDKNRTLEKTTAENLNIIREWRLWILKVLDVEKKMNLKKKRYLLSCNIGEFIEKDISSMKKEGKKSKNTYPFRKLFLPFMPLSW